MSLKATPSDGMRFGVAAGDDMDGLRHDGAYAYFPLDANDK